MDLSHTFDRFTHQKKEEKEVFLSLIADVDVVVAACWHVDEKRLPALSGIATKEVVGDSWDERIKAADEAISSLEKPADAAAVHHVILGLPAIYLTPTGDISKDIRSPLKKLTQTLELVPMGFVSIYQAVVHNLKREEGVPPTVILLGLSGNTLTTSVYKIGALVGQKSVEKKEDVVAQFEETLQSFKELEVLPSRILLYGAHTSQLEDVKRELLHHPWQTRANFMHFPKIDVLPIATLIKAVSLVGTNELAVSLGPEPEEEVVVQEAETHKDEEEVKEESNVVLVDPEQLGFKRSVDVLNERLSAEKVEQADTAPPEEAPLPEKKAMAFSLPKKLPFSIPHIPFRFSLRPLFSVSSSVRRWPGVVAIVVLIFASLWGFYWFVPRASVTIYEMPKKLSQAVAITIDPTATVADSSTKTLPGKKQEKTISGEKTITVTGKKQIGDPAKGTVTIYNKVTSARTFTKGTVLLSGNLQFTLDSDISVASASESIGSITFGKTNANITASAIGTQSNLPAGSDFTFKSVASGVVAARNDQPLTGGTSRDVTVVSRADQNNLVTAITKELVDKAKQELATAVGGDEQLIDATIKTSVVDKSFVEELDQEAKELHGKVTITVSGTSYSTQDITSLLTGVIAGDVPSGYAFDPKYTKITLGDAQVKKDGKIAGAAQFEGIATPKLDTVTIGRTLGGKTIASAQEYLKTIQGVGGVAFRIQLSPWKDRLPANTNNISVTVAVQE